MDFPSIFTDTLDMDSPRFDNTICICLLVDRFLRETMFFSTSMAMVYSQFHGPRRTMSPFEG